MHQEKRGTLAIENPLSLCPHLDAYIDTNDKTPLTDGFILIYQGLSRKKDEILGRVDVQIKARTIKHKLAPGSFRMQRSELEAIRQLGTVLLFVVFIKPDGSYLGRPKYAILSPFTIGDYLSEMKKSATTFAVPLRDLPEDLSKIERIVGIALRTKSQTVTVGSGVALLQRSKSINISSAHDLNFDEPVVISYKTGDYVIEVETPEGTLLPLPGELEIFPASYTERPLQATLMCGGVEVTDATIRQTDPQHYVIKVSEGLTLTHAVDGGALRTGSVSLTLVDNLAQRVRDMDFYLALASGDSLHLDGVELQYELSSHSPQDDLTAVRARTEKLLQLFRRFHIDPALIQMNEITDEQHSQIRHIYGAIFEGVELSPEDGDSKPALVYVDIGSWRLLLLLIPDTSTGLGIPLDPFDPVNRNRFRLYSTDESGEPVEAEATVYDMLQQDELPLILNLNPPTIADAYRAVSTASNLTWLANRTVLRLIHAADATLVRRSEFLEAARELNDWLEDVGGPSAPGILNRYQITAREAGGLSPEDTREIRALRRRILAETSASGLMHEAGCAILLGDRDELADCMSRLSEAEREDLQSYPIWTLTQVMS